MTALLDALDASIVSVCNARDLNPGFRIDAEFFSRSALSALACIRRGRHEPLGQLCAKIQHPVEVKREYEDAGLLTVMAKNVRSNRIELGDPRFMPAELRSTVERNKLAKGDVLVTRTGANFGQSASWKQDAEAFACADILVLRRPSIPSGYLSSFLESSKGKPLVLRGGYGAGQPHVAPSYLCDLPIPRFSRLEGSVDQLVDASVCLQKNAVEALSEAEGRLVVSLGLDSWTPTEPLSYTSRAAKSVLCRRLDSRFFAPRIQALLDILSVDGRAVSDVARPRHEKFRTEQNVMSDYIEIGDMDGSGSVSSTRMASIDAPSRAAWYVRPNDIITSTVRPIRRLSAQIRPDQNEYVCSSGFVVIEPRDIAPEVLLTFLRLPAICELLDLYASASMYPAIAEGDIFNLPMPLIPKQVCNDVVDKVKKARAAKLDAAWLLDAAKRAVEIAIEDDESAAINWVATALEMI